MAHDATPQFPIAPLLTAVIPAAPRLTADQRQAARLARGEPPDYYDAQVIAAVDAAPPLTDEQRRTLRRLFTGAVVEADALCPQPHAGGAA